MKRRLAGTLAAALLLASLWWLAVEIGWIAIGGQKRVPLLDHPDRAAAEFGVRLADDEGGGWQS